MQALLVKIPDLIQVILLFIGALTLLATLVVRLTPSKADDEYVSNFTKGFLKVLHWLPTIGINPQTKKLEETLVEVQAACEVPPTPSVTTPQAGT